MNLVPWTKEIISLLGQATICEKKKKALKKKHAPEKVFTSDRMTMRVKLMVKNHKSIIN